MWHSQKSWSLTAGAVLLTATGALAGVPFTETFEALALGQLDGQGGWHGWDGLNTPFADVVNTQAHNGTKSAEVSAGADSVTEFNYTTGRWIIRAWTFAPTNFVGKTYFIVLNAYQNGGPYEWSGQIGFNGDAGRFECDCGTAGVVVRALVRGTWTDVVLDVDLDADTVDVYYNTASESTPIATYIWTGGVFGGNTYATTAIEAIDLYPDAVTFPQVSPFYFDDISIEAPGSGSGTPVCFGDGSGLACPCGNTGGSGEGCANSTGGGAILTASGTPSVTADTLSLTSDGARNDNGLFFQGNNTIAGGSGQVFGDGLRCCGGGVVRIQVVNPPGTTSPTTHQMTETATTNGPAGTILPGQKKCYQLWYRDPGAGSPCANFFNLSSAVSVTWQP